MNLRPQIIFTRRRDRHFKIPVARKRGCQRLISRHPNGYIFLPKENLHKFTCNTKLPSEK